MPVKKTDFLSTVSAPARRALEGKGLTSLKKIAAHSAKELLALHGIGPSTIPILKAALREQGLDFKNESAPPKKTIETSKEVLHYYKDGSLWAKGKLYGDTMDGYWEWYRKNGVIMRSGYFKKGKQLGEWTTYDKDGKVYKVTKMKEPA